MRLHCGECGKVVSTEVPDDTVVRAWIECPECIEKADYDNPGSQPDVRGFDSRHGAPADSDIQG